MKNTKNPINHFPNKKRLYEKAHFILYCAFFSYYIGLLMQTKNYSSIYFFVSIYIIFAFFSYTNPSESFIQAMMLDSSVWQGQIWRLFTYNFIIQESNIIFLLLHILVFIYIALPLEEIWGVKFFVAFYLVSIICGGLTALFCGLRLIGSWHTDLTLMLLHGFIFPQSRIALFFIFPIRIKYFAIFCTIFFIMGALSQGIATGIFICVGMLSGVLFYLIFKKPVLISVKPKQDKKTKNAIQLYDKAIAIYEHFQNNTVTQEEKEWIEDLIKDVWPERELCSPYTFSPTCQVCPNCSCYKICLQRHIKDKIKELP